MVKPQTFNRALGIHNGSLQNLIQCPHCSKNHYYAKYRIEKENKLNQADSDIEERSQKEMWDSVADNVEYGRRDVSFTRIVEWLFLNDKQFSSGTEWKQEFIKFLKEIL